MTDEATAFVPGHVTGFFSVHRADDPTEAGSTGAGVTLTDGVEVTVRATDGTDVYLDDTSIDMPPVERVLSALGVEARVTATSDLPLGAGFGVSGAMALGTAVAANAVFETALSENELVRLAHGAEVQSGTGLGDVVAQARGGLPIRLDPGAPPAGTLDGVPTQSRVEYVAFGELSTETVLSGDTDQLSEAGRQALSRLVSEPTLPQFMYASRRFAREAGLLTERVRDAVVAVSDAGGEASMAMLGQTVFALGTGLSDAGFDPDVCETHGAGATLLRSD
jgi:pantoate kinase